MVLSSFCLSLDRRESAVPGPHPTWICSSISIGVSLYRRESAVSSPHPTWISSSIGIGVSLYRRESAVSSPHPTWVSTSLLMVLSSLSSLSSLFLTSICFSVWNIDVVSIFTTFLWSACLITLRCILSISIFWCILLVLWTWSVLSVLFSSSSSSSSSLVIVVDNFRLVGCIDIFSNIWSFNSSIVSSGIFYISRCN
ncbi:predicted protein [Lodderomyces elongisporus NRRL YB-4239]|uniref:Uncharacterized protein n=1 Tax=Lodderomyces elongisporus (strain ATCC 11503 / CBS 2605 / JCM 1781 / NBRC 1676 / NRRL YB-4239) TaxID=379508 RepID=A5E6S2_LODEL|nr:predicted protein [Lodderomyces elongisporus NRRL YB-4239]